jgi:hypothetical protein
MEYPQYISIQGLITLEFKPSRKFPPFVAERTARTYSAAVRSTCPPSDAAFLSLVMGANALHGLYGYILHIQIIHNLTYYIFLGISSGTRVRFYARVGLA